MPQAYDEEEKRRVAWKVCSLYALYGFDGISMQEVADRVHVSKATMYKFFGSKEEIVRHMVSMACRYFDSIRFNVSGGIQSVLTGTEELFVKFVLVNTFSSSPFIADLKHRYPGLFDEIRNVGLDIRARVETFYDECVEKGYFRPLSIQIVLRQFNDMIPVLLDEEYRASLNLTFDQAMKEYYHVFLCQLLTGTYEDVITGEYDYAFLDDLCSNMEHTMAWLREEGKKNLPNSKQSHHTGRFLRRESVPQRNGRAFYGENRSPAGGEGKTAESFDPAGE